MRSIRPLTSIRARLSGELSPLLSLAEKLEARSLSSFECTRGNGSFLDASLGRPLVPRCSLTWPLLPGAVVLLYLVGMGSGRFKAGSTVSPFLILVPSWLTTLAREVSLLTCR